MDNNNEFYLGERPTKGGSNKKMDRNIYIIRITNAAFASKKKASAWYWLNQVQNIKIQFFYKNIKIQFSLKFEQTRLYSLQ